MNYLYCLHVVMLNDVGTSSFDHATCWEWLAAGGKATIMQCVAERRGQGRLRLA